MTLSEFVDIAAIIGGVIAILSLVVTAYNTRVTVLTNQAQFWSDLRDKFSRHDKVHRHLRPSGLWTNGGQASAYEWADLEAYMGLFEHCENMLDVGLIDKKTFKDIYAYRLKNIVVNDRIKKTKLQDVASGWKRFLALLKRTDYREKREKREAICTYAYYCRKCKKKFERVETSCEHNSAKPRCLDPDCRSDKVENVETSFMDKVGLYSMSTANVAVICGLVIGALTLIVLALLVFGGDILVRSAQHLHRLLPGFGEGPLGRHTGRLSRRHGRRGDRDRGPVQP